MITQTKKFYYVEAKTDHITVRPEDFPDGPLPLVWNNRGLYGVICVGIINNMIQLLSDLASLPKLEKNQQGGRLHWDDALPHHSKDINRILQNLCV